MASLAEKIVARIRENRYKFGGGSFVLAMADGKVFVLGEQAITTRRLVDSREQFLVGLYAGVRADGRRTRCPKAAQIAGDLEQHLKDLGVLFA